MSRPPSRPGLGTTTRRELCWFLAQGFSKEDAATKAGLPDTYRLHAFARTKEFAGELQEALRDHLGTNLAPKDIRILNEIMSDSAVTPRVRVDAAKALLDRAGYASGEEPRRIPTLDNMESMTIDELQNIVGKLEQDIKDEANRRADGAVLIAAPEIEHSLQS